MAPQKTEDSLKHGIAALAKKIPNAHIPEEAKLSLGEQEEPQKAVEQVLKWLSIAENNSWLLMIDNVRTARDRRQEDATAFNIESYLPKANHGHILITTREPQNGQPGSYLKLEVMDPIEAENLLTEHIGRDCQGVSIFERKVKSRHPY